MLKQVVIWAAFVVAVAFSHSVPAHAGIILATDITQPVTSSGLPEDQTVGYAFGLTQAYTVYSLGIWDNKGNGLGEAHQVGLWDSAGTSLLANVTVPSGTSGTYVESAAGSTVGGWRFTDLGAPVTLSAGNYLLGAYYTTKNDSALDSISASDYSLAPGLTFVQSRFRAGAFSAPTSNAGLDAGYFGPNFQGTAVPEPSSALLALVAVGIGGCYKRFRRKSE